MLASKDTSGSAPANNNRRPRLPKGDRWLLIVTIIAVCANICLAVVNFSLIWTVGSEDLGSKVEQTVTPQAVRAALLEKPEILEEVISALAEKNVAKQKVASKKLVEDHVDEIFLADANFIGNPDGKIVIVEFQDYQCGFCRAAAPVLQSAVDENPDLKVIIRELPVIDDVSVFAAYAALAAGEQGLYKEMHDALLSKGQKMTEEDVISAAKAAGADMELLSKRMASDDIKAKVERDLSLARTLGINGTPSFISRTKGIMSGFKGAEELMAFADAK
ncbi:DsbA family protein [Thalassospira xianhensis]|uniref:DsbA family protein n=1 Tax=Thalassospira xianhensis TaxID=478503 RepID=UPI000DED3F07|nr:DsbA family protein [Thalassospira xianhensis]